MDLEEFRSELLARIGSYAVADSNFTHSAFVDVVIQYIEDAGEVTDFQPCYYRGTTRRRNVAIDGYSFDKADDSLRLFVADLTLDKNATLTQTDAKTIFGRLRAFAEEAIDRRLQEGLDGNSPAMALADEIADSANRISSMRAYLLTDAVLSHRVKDWPEDAIGGIPIEFHIWDIARFYRAHSAFTGQDELTIDFTKDGSVGIPCLYGSTEGSPYTAYLCVIPGKVLADIYDAYGSRLLEGNVRTFLSAKGKINKGIRNTAMHSPEMFFAYNNGIAATASAVTVSKNEDGLYLTSATDLQIVNGGQTTASLATARRNDKADVERTFVPMKLSVIDPEKSVEMIPLISRFANSQNKVSDADFFSNHEYHRRLEQISRRLWAPAKSGSQHETHWFYERARGQYLNETVSASSADKRRFLEMNPRDQVITKTDLAKSENSWSQLPQKVSRGAQYSFIQFAENITARWEKDRDSFHEEYFKAVVARIILFRSTERIVLRQAWYSGGYRANIVTYAIAKLSHDIEHFASGVLDFKSIWQHQFISEAFSAQIALYAEAIYPIITSTPVGQQNVTQWCKRDDCWERAKNLSLEFTPEFNSELRKKEDLQSADRVARAIQRVDSGIDAQTCVISLGHEYWSEFLSWGLNHGFVTPEDERIIRIAAGFGGFLPNDKQCKRLLQMQRRFEEEGFRPASASGGS